MTSILGSDADDRLGVWSAVGDVNGDGAPDLVMGADRATHRAGPGPRLARWWCYTAPFPGARRST